MIEIINVRDLKGWKDREIQKLKKQLAEILKDKPARTYYFKVFRPLRADFTKCKTLIEMRVLEEKIKARTFTDREARRYKIRLTKHYIISAPYLRHQIPHTISDFIIAVKKTDKGEKIIDENDRV